LQIKIPDSSNIFMQLMKNTGVLNLAFTTVIGFDVACDGFIKLLKTVKSVMQKDRVVS
jgi:hypothetical protein